jgi:hypothetical protein
MTLQTPSVKWFDSDPTALPSFKHLIKTYFNRKRWEIKEYNGELGGNFVMFNG